MFWLRSLILRFLYTSTVRIRLRLEYIYQGAIFFSETNKLGPSLDKPFLIILIHFYFTELFFSKASFALYVSYCEELIYWPVIIICVCAYQNLSS